MKSLKGAQCFDRYMRHNIPKATLKRSLEFIVKFQSEIQDPLHYDCNNKECCGTSSHLTVCGCAFLGVSSEQDSERVWDKYSPQSL